MLSVIINHSDHIVAAMFLLIAIALLVARPKMSCCRQQRWERRTPRNRWLD